MPTPEEIRDEIADQTGLPSSVLRGDTREEIQAHADQLLALQNVPRQYTAAEIVDRALGKTSDVDDIINQATGR